MACCRPPVLAVTVCMALLYDKVGHSFPKIIDKVSCPEQTDSLVVDVMRCGVVGAPGQLWFGA